MPGENRHGWSIGGLYHKMLSVSASVEDSPFSQVPISQQPFSWALTPVLIPHVGPSDDTTAGTRLSSFWAGGSGPFRPLQQNHSLFSSNIAEWKGKQKFESNDCFLCGGEGHPLSWEHIWILICNHFHYLWGHWTYSCWVQFTKSFAWIRGRNIRIPLAWWWPEDYTRNVSRNWKEAKSWTSALTCNIQVGRKMHHSREAIGVGCSNIVICRYVLRNTWVNFPRDPRCPRQAKELFFHHHHMSLPRQF